MEKTKEIEEEYIKQVYNMASIETILNKGKKGIIGNFLEIENRKKQNWVNLLREILEYQNNDYSYLKFDNRYINQEIYLPSLYSQEIGKIAVFIDCSGSIEIELTKQFITELQGIKESFNNIKIDLFCFDTKVYQELFDFDFDFSKLEITEGGTRFDSIAEKLEELQENYKKVLIFTDGQDYITKDFDNSLWIIYNNLNFEYSQGEVIYVNEIEE